MTEAEAEAEAVAFLAVVKGRQPPDTVAWRAGYDAHAAGQPFHAGPRPFHTVVALSWRIGWNARALAPPEGT